MEFQRRSGIVHKNEHRGIMVILVPLVILVAFGFLALKKSGLLWPPSLDFTGGVRLEYQINEEDAIRKGLETSTDRKNALTRAQEIFLLRLQSFDLSEIVVKPVGDNRLIVEVPGTKAIERVKREIGTAAVLTFRLVEGKYLEGREEFANLPPEIKQNFFQFRSRSQYIEVGEPILDASDIAYHGTRVETSRVTLDNPRKETYVKLELKPSSRNKFAELTTMYYGRQLAICLDNRIETAPQIADRNISEPIITGNFSESQAKELVKILRAGPLPVSFKLNSEVLISPKLGKKTLEQGMIALILGICFVILILGLSYIDHLSMLVTLLLCLVLEGILLFMLGQMGWITLNMVSLSGLIVLLGISVDNLILVFEEFRSTVSGEAGFRRADWGKAFSRAFQNEMSIIFWANITTIATLIPLYFLSGPIKDLVAVMFLGIFIALIINVWYARHLLEESKFVSPLEKIHSIIRPFLTKRFNLFSVSRPLLTIYLISVIISIFFLYNQGFVKGLDFKEGIEISLLSDEGLQTDDLRSVANNYFGKQCEVKRVTQKFGSEQEFKYIIRVPHEERLAAEAINEGQRGKQASSNTIETTAEEFIDFMSGKITTPIRTESVELLGKTVVTSNRKVVIISIIVGLLFLIVFISSRYGPGFAVPVVGALILDGVIIFGAISLFHVPLSIPVIAAALTVVGYSINDSIVLCGHVHRSLDGTTVYRGEQEGEESVEVQSTPQYKDFKSILEPLSSRVILTSITTLGVAVALWIFGYGILQHFGLVITIGVTFGTISSISLVAIGLERIYQSYFKTTKKSEIIVEDYRYN